MRIALAFAFALACSACGSKSSGPTTPPPSEGDTGSGGNGSATPSDPAADCVCTMQYDPVCGADGKTYGNACQAGCAKVEVASQGECPQ